jgi:hypothetical protein
MLTACGCDGTPSAESKDPDAIYTVALPPGFTQTLDESAPTEYGELRFGEHVIVENRTGDRTRVSLRRTMPMSALGDVMPPLGEIPLPSKGLIAGPMPDLTGATTISLTALSVRDRSWMGFTSWTPDPWGRRIVIDRDDSGELRLRTFVFVPPEEHQPGVDVPDSWDYHASASADDVFRLVVNDRLVIENAFGHRNKAFIRLEFNESDHDEVIAMLPSRGVAHWRTERDPLWVKVTMMQVPVIGASNGAQSMDRGFESRVGERGLTVRFRHDETGYPSIDHGVGPVD